jgi:hypothetical protein
MKNRKKQPLIQTCTSFLFVTSVSIKYGFVWDSCTVFGVFSSKECVIETLDRDVATSSGKVTTSSLSFS